MTQPTTRQDLRHQGEAMLRALFGSSVQTAGFGHLLTEAAYGGIWGRRGRFISGGKLPNDLARRIGNVDCDFALRCVAAVVYNDCAEPLAAVSISGLTSRITDARLPDFGKAVRTAAAELTLALGGVMPPQQN